MARSPVRKPQDLIGKKIGVVTLGGTAHGYALAGTKAIGIDKEVRFVATGGIRAGMAALKTGAIDALVRNRVMMMKLKVAGEVREPLNISKYIPEEWVSDVSYAAKDFTRRDPEAVKRMVGTLLEGIKFVRKNRPWALKTMGKVQGYSPEVAGMVYDFFRFTTDGRLNRSAIQNVRSFVAEYGLVPKERIPAVENLYTNKFTN